MGKQKNNFFIADGPVFTNGLPHIAHTMISSIKDCYMRYVSQKGYKPETILGWDCHGFPVENEIEKKFNLKSKQDVKEFGIANFAKECEKSVFTYKQEWEKMFASVKRDLDYSNYYATMTDSYMNSVWWAFKQFFDKNLVYKTHKPNFYSTKLESVVSNFEAQQNYKLTKETSVYVKFKVKNFTNTYFLVWTTTPWTLPANQCLAINSSINYCIVAYNGDQYILAESLISGLFKDAQVVKTIAGKELVDFEYKPMFNHFGLCSGKVVSAEFVTESAGTGIVHIAPGFGEEDYKTFKSNFDLDIVNHLNPNGTFKDQVKEFAGQYVFDNKVIEYLEQNCLFKKEEVEHSIPYCWRTDVPLIRYPAESWCLKVSQYKERLKELNQTVNWVPDHIQNGRFGNWLNEVKDWNVSRDRIWGCQIPIWENANGDVMCFGSFDELNKFVKVKGYHKPEIDQAAFYHPDYPQEEKYLMNPVPYVFDCWFESGCMPFAQYNNLEKFKENFPCDLIVEGIDQTRGWFYSLLVISTVLFDVAPYKNVIVTGHINDENGNKYSKRNKNYVPAQQILEEYGSDAVRMTFFNSSIYQGEGINFSLKLIDDSKSNFVLPIENLIKFYAMQEVQEIGSETIFDVILKEKSNKFCNTISSCMDKFDVLNASKNVYEFIQFISVFYIKNNRERFMQGDSVAISELKAALAKLSMVIYPFMPNLSEFMESFVGRSTWEVFEETNDDKFEFIKAFIDLNNKVRAKNKLGAKYLLQKAWVSIPFEYSSLAKEFCFKDIEYKDDFVKVKKPNFQKIGKEFGQKTNEVVKLIKQNQDKYLDYNLSDYVIEEIVEDNSMVFSKLSSGQVMILKIDTTKTKESDELSFVKEVKKQISSYRKNKGYSFKDKVKIEYSSSDYVKCIVEKYSDMFHNTILEHSVSAEFTIEEK